jgi:hypothetical protein
MCVTDGIIPSRVQEIEFKIKTIFRDVHVIRFSFQSLVISFPRGQCRMLLCVPKDRDLSRVYCEPCLVLDKNVLIGSSIFPLFFTSWNDTLQGIYRFYFRFVCLYIMTHFQQRVFALQPSCHHQKIPSLYTLMMYALSTQELAYLKHLTLPSFSV